jgi:hypothetical protein
LRRCEHRSQSPFDSESNMSAIEDCSVWIVPR